MVERGSTTAERTITELRKLFATHGLPTQVVTGFLFNFALSLAFLLLSAVTFYFW